MKKLLLFPYHHDIHTLVEHRDYLDGYEICGVASFKEDASLVQQLNKELRGTQVDDCTLLQTCDAVLLLDNYRGYKTDKYYEVIQRAIDAEKEVLLTPLTETQLNMEPYSDHYKLLEKLPAGMSDIEIEYSTHDRFEVGIRMYETEIPVIAVLGQGKNCSKFETQLLLKELFPDEYSFACVCTNALGALFGCYTMPAFLYSEEKSFQEKIIKFNFYIRKIIKEQQTDGLLLGVPEGITPFRQKEYHHFAEYPLVISSAVKIDMAVFCTYFTGSTVSDKALAQLSNFCKGRFGVSVSAAIVSRTTYNIPDQPNEAITFDLLEKRFLDQSYPDMTSIQFPLISLLDRSMASKVIQNSLLQLERNIESV